jgi:hypothetical protein
VESCFSVEKVHNGFIVDRKLCGVNRREVYECGENVLLEMCNYFNMPFTISTRTSEQGEAAKLEAEQVGKASGNISRDAIAAVDKYMSSECVALSTRWAYMQAFRDWLQQHPC